jgi:hypothetical protein
VVVFAAMTAVTIPLPAVSRLPSRTAELLDEIVRVTFAVGAGDRVIVIGVCRFCPTLTLETVILPPPATAATVRLIVRETDCVLNGVESVTVRVTG